MLLFYPYCPGFTIVISENPCYNYTNEGEKYMNRFLIRGYNPCESLLRHTPGQLTDFIRRMKKLNLNTIIIHSDYGWKRYRELIERECAAAGIEITLMVFGPRSFFSLTDWKKSWFAADESGRPMTDRPECETHPCASDPEAVEAFQEGAERWLAALPRSIRRVHMRAGDGLMFCRCPKCRQLPEHEQWHPFVAAFVRAAAKVRPELKLETDLYVRRYFVPRDREPYERLDRLMFDTFYRHPFYPIGSDRDQCNRKVMQYAAPEGWSDAETPNQFYRKRLEEWGRAFPGKIYIHENVMCQGYFGCSQHNTGVYLQDQQLYRDLDLGGVCYEAYEPGYEAFASIFDSLAAGRRTSPEEPLEKILQETGMTVFCTDPDFPLEKWLDPFYCRLAELQRKKLNGMDAASFRELVDFEWQNEMRLDPVLTGYAAARGGMLSGKLRFDGISGTAKDFISRRKLWDFMEEIPSGQDPRAVCRELIMELAEKVKDGNS